MLEFAWKEIPEIKDWLRNIFNKIKNCFIYLLFKQYKFFKYITEKFAKNYVIQTKNIIWKRTVKYKGQIQSEHISDRGLPTLIFCIYSPKLLRFLDFSYWSNFYWSLIIPTDFDFYYLSNELSKIQTITASSKDDENHNQWLIVN